MSCYLQFHDIFEKTIPMKTLALYSFVSFFLSPASRLQYSGSDTKIYFSGLRGGGGRGVEKFVCRAGIHKHLGNPNLLDPMVWEPEVGTFMRFALARFFRSLKPYRLILPPCPLPFSPFQNMINKISTAHPSSYSGQIMCVWGVQYLPMFHYL